MFMSTPYFWGADYESGVCFCQNLHFTKLRTFSCDFLGEKWGFPKTDVRIVISAPNNGGGHNYWPCTEFLNFSQSGRFAKRFLNMARIKLFPKFMQHPEVLHVRYKPFRSIKNPPHINVEKFCVAKSSRKKCPPYDWPTRYKTPTLAKCAEDCGVKADCIGFIYPQK